MIEVVTRAIKEQGTKKIAKLNLVTVQRWLAVPEHSFAVIFCVFGLFFLLVIPPIQVADENNHFFRAYQVAQGQLVSKKTDVGVGGYLPSGVIDFARLANKNQIAFHQNQHFFPRSQLRELANLSSRSVQEPIEFVNTALYSPVSYLVPSLAIKLSSLVTDRVIVQFYLARLADFLLLGLSFYFAIKIIPFGKWPLVVLCLLPMTLYEAVSISADVYLLAVTALFISYWLSLYRLPNITLRQWLVLAVLALGLAFSKQSYFVFAGVVPLLLVPVCRSQALFKKRFLPIGIISLGSLSIALLWMFITRNFNPEFIRWAAANGIVGANPHTQFYVLFHEPVHFAAILLNTWLTNSGNYIWWTTFGEFGWLDAPLPLTLVLPLAVVTFLSFGIPEDRQQFKDNSAIITTVSIWILAFINFMAITAILFAFWTTPGSAVILAYQGRYFIPLLIFLIPVLAGRYVHSISRYTLLLGMIVILAGSTCVLIARYYDVASIIGISITTR